MHARKLIPILATLPIWLGGCAPGPTQFAPVASIPAALAPAADRRAEIGRQLAKICPVPLTAAELDRLARLVDRLARDGEAVWLAGRLDLADLQARVCRGEKVVS